MAQLVVHASKIPEKIQDRSRDDRMLSGDMVYVNACNDLPWTKVPLHTPRSDVVVCAACQYIVEINRKVRTGTGPRG